MTWQPIETAPSGTPVLLYGVTFGELGGVAGPLAVVGERQAGSALWLVVSTEHYSVAVQPTHWMRVPPPPTKDPAE